MMQKVVGAVVGVYEWAMAGVIPGQADWTALMLFLFAGGSYALTIACFGELVAVIAGHHPRLSAPVRFVCRLASRGLSNLLAFGMITLIVARCLGRNLCAGLAVAAIMLLAFHGWLYYTRRRARKTVRG